MKLIQIERKLKKIENSISSVNPNGAIAEAMTLQYRYLTDLKQKTV